MGRKLPVVLMLVLKLIVKPRLHGVENVRVILADSVSHHSLSHVVITVNTEVGEHEAEDEIHDDDLDEVGRIVLLATSGDGHHLSEAVQKLTMGKKSPVVQTHVLKLRVKTHLHGVENVRVILPDSVSHHS